MTTFRSFPTAPKPHQYVGVSAVISWRGDQLNKISFADLTSFYLKYTGPVSSPINKTSMKIVKHIFRRSNAKHQAKAEADEGAKHAVLVKTIKKRALLIGVKDIREPVKGVRAGVKPPQRGPVTQLKSRLKVVRKTNKLQSLKGPHRDVREMRELLISELHPFFVIASLCLTSLDTRYLQVLT